MRIRRLLKVSSFVMSLLLLFSVLAKGVLATTNVTLIEETYMTAGDHLDLGRINGQTLSWEILSISGNSVLLLCDCIVDMVVLESTSNYQYGDSALKNWCDGFFSSEVFTDEERNAILETTVDGLGGQTFFVLSKSEFLNFFPDGVGGMRKYLSGLNGEQGAFGLGTGAISNEEPVFWLRSMNGSYWIDLTSYDNDGSFEDATCANISIYDSSYGICPAVYLDISIVEELWHIVISAEESGSTIAVEFRLQDQEHTLSTATQYVPYHETIPAVSANSSFSLASGKLPDGLNLSQDGVISGFPLELGVFSFKVTETYDGGSTEHKCSLSVYSRMYADVEANNVPGYGFVETATDDGRVNDQVVTSAEELTDQVMHCEGAFSEFQNLYIDARRLIRGVEYYAEEGSTKLTILSETIGEEGGGTHTVAAEFKTGEGEIIYTVQNYTVLGIASRDVHVTVDGEVVIWTDAEPFIDTNSRTMTPFRAVGDALGLEIAWDGTTREASFSNGSKTIFFPIGSTTARTGTGTTVKMDTSAVIVNGRTYAPIRYLAEFFGCSVDWEGKSRTVMIR